MRILAMRRVTMQVSVAEVGLNMAQFPTAHCLVPWARISLRTIQSGKRSRSGKTDRATLT
jgi:transposase